MAGSNKFIAAKPISLAEIHLFFKNGDVLKPCLAKDARYLGADKEIAAGAAVGRHKYSRVVFAPMIKRLNVFTDGGMGSSLGNL
jgi:hypothetical protein